MAKSLRLKTWRSYLLKPSERGCAHTKVHVKLKEDTMAVEDVDMKEPTAEVKEEPYDK